MFTKGGERKFLCVCVQVKCLCKSKRVSNVSFFHICFFVHWYTNDDASMSEWGSEREKERKKGRGEKKRVCLISDVCPSVNSRSVGLSSLSLLSDADERENGWVERAQMDMKRNRERESKCLMDCEICKEWESWIMTWFNCCNSIDMWKSPVMLVSPKNVLCEMKLKVNYDYRCYL